MLSSWCIGVHVVLVGSKGALLTRSDLLAATACAADTTDASLDLVLEALTHDALLGQHLVASRLLVTRGSRHLIIVILHSALLLSSDPASFLRSDASIAAFTTHLLLLHQVLTLLHTALHRCELRVLD